MNAMKTLVRRELWEHRAIALVPLAFGGLFVLVNLLAALGVVRIQVDAGDMDFGGLVGSLDPEKADSLVQLGLAMVAMSLNTVMVFVTAFYLLDCLYAERKDRSILFWKSLPVSDTGIVGSKLLTAAVVVPVVTLVVFVAAGLCMYVITGLTVQFAGSSHILGAGPAALAEVTLAHAYALVVQTLWYLPIFGWLLLVSAWSRRAALLWAILPPVAVNVIERLVFGTSHFANLLRERLIGVYPLAFSDHASRDPMVWQYQDNHANVNLELSRGLLELLDPGKLLASPGLWGGIAVAGVFFAAAVWMRRYRDDS